MTEDTSGKKLNVELDLDKYTPRSEVAHLRIVIVLLGLLLLAVLFG